MEGMNLEDIIRKEVEIGVSKEYAQNAALIIYDYVLSRTLSDFEADYAPIPSAKQNVYRSVMYGAFCLARELTNAGMMPPIDSEVIVKFKNDEDICWADIFDSFDEDIRYKAFSFIESYEKHIKSPVIVQEFFTLIYCTMCPSLIDEYEVAEDNGLLEYEEGSKVRKDKNKKEDDDEETVSK